MFVAKSKLKIGIGIRLNYNTEQSNSCMWPGGLAQVYNYTYCVWKTANRRVSYFIDKMCVEV